MIEDDKDKLYPFMQDAYMALGELASVGNEIGILGMSKTMQITIDLVEVLRDLLRDQWQQIVMQQHPGDKRRLEWRPKTNTAPSAEPSATATKST